MPNELIVITGKKNIAMYRLLAMKYALSLEVKGLRSSRGSVYALVKREFGFKGCKQRVLDQFTLYIEDLKRE